MTPPLDSVPARAHCEACGSPLAADQRYCLTCGTRHGALPANIAGLIGSMRQRDALAGGGRRRSARGGARGVGVPDAAPRAAAIAVMALLGFGVILGSTVSPTAQSAASAPVLVAYAPAPAAAPAPTPAPAAPTDDTPPPADDSGDVGVTPVVTPDPVPVATPPAPAPTTPAAGGDSGPEQPSTPPPPTLPPVKHVFLIVLSDQGYAQSFGDETAAPYLAKTLPAQGELLSNYYAVAGSELANGIALVSGQGPTVQTTANCPQVTDITPGTVGDDGQILGDGCLYPIQARTIADQLTTNGRTWKAYVESVADAASGTTSCRHPALGAPDGDAAPDPTDPYVTWRNPFVYFHSLIDTKACATDDVGLDALTKDLATESTTPTFSYIVPNRFHDGSDEPSAPDQPAGLAGADAFLKTVVPEIQRSAAYKDGGLIAITFDQAPQTGPDADSSACCDTPPYPNLPAPGTATTPATTTSTTPTTTPVDPSAASSSPVDPAAPATTDPSAASSDPAAPATPTVPATTPTSTTPTTTTTTPATTTTTPVAPAADSGVVSPTGGGGRVGLLLLSPYVKPGTVNSTGYFNHFSLLRSFEQLFSLDEIGYTNEPALPAFDKTVFNGTY